MMSKVIEIPAQAELDRHFSAMGDSVDLINAIVAGQVNFTAEEKADCLDRNVRHLEIMKAKGWFDGYDMSAVDAAIAASAAYQAQQTV